MGSNVDLLCLTSAVNVANITCHSSIHCLVSTSQRFSVLFVSCHAIRLGDPPLVALGSCGTSKSKLSTLWTLFLPLTIWPDVLLASSTSCKLLRLLNLRRNLLAPWLIRRRKFCAIILKIYLSPVTSECLINIFSVTASFSFDHHLAFSQAISVSARTR